MKKLQYIIPELLQIDIHNQEIVCTSIENEQFEDSGSFTW